MINLLLTLLFFQSVNIPIEPQKFQIEPPVASGEVLDYCSLKVITCEEEKEETPEVIIDRVCKEMDFNQCETLKRIAFCESSMDPKAKNKNSNY